MESLALIASIIVLGRIAYTALCVALIISFLHHRFFDGVLQARPGIPSSPWFTLGLIIAVVGLVLHFLTFWGK